MVFPFDARGTPQNARTLVFGPYSAEIAHQSRPQLFRFTHVQHFAFTTEKAIRARPILRADLHQLAQSVEVGDRLATTFSLARDRGAVTRVIEQRINGDTDIRRRQR